MNFLIRGLLAPANFLLDVMRGVPSFKKKQLSLWGSIFFVASQLRSVKTLYIFFVTYLDKFCKKNYSLLHGVRYPLP